MPELTAIYPMPGPVIVEGQKEEAPRSLAEDKFINICKDFDTNDTFRSRDAISGVFIIHSSDISTEDMRTMPLQGRSLVDGTAFGELLYSETGLSVFGGIDPRTGKVIDRHHPLCGNSVVGKILAVPSGRGSCSGSTVLLELLLAGCSPAGLVFREADQIMTLGVLVGEILFDRSIPVLVLPPEDFSFLPSAKFAAITSSALETADTPLTLPSYIPRYGPDVSTVQLSQRDADMLSGRHGDAARVAMEIILRFSVVEGATTLIDISKSHIDACIYTGPACLRFAKKFSTMGARFVVPTTLNAISIDKRRWREMGLEPELASQADELANTYVTMGAMATFTCAPYILESVPKAGEDIGWSESNAVAFANSVLGARTQKYPDFIDVCTALTGRAPLAGCHLEEGRLPGIAIELPNFDLDRIDDSLYPLLGYCIGDLTGQSIPLVCGLEHLDPTWSDLKAFSAAFATTSPAPMFHIRGVTPEAKMVDEKVEGRLTRIIVRYDVLVRCWDELNTANDSSVGLVSLGNPHFSVEEFAQLVRLLPDRRKSPDVDFMVTTSRHTYSLAYKERYIQVLEEFGASIITDTCWCMIDEPVIKHDVRNIMTNSAKYAHYGPGMVKRGIHFGSLAQCVDAICNAAFDASTTIPLWLKK